MSDDAKEQPPRVWLPKVVLTFLVFLALFFVVYQTTVGLGDRDLGQRSLWALLVAMGLLILLPVVDRIQTISISPTGFEATLTEAKARALEEVGALEDREVAEAAREQILQAGSTDQVQAATALAVELNANRVIDRVEEAIRQRRKLYVRYRPDPAGPIETYQVAPFDIKPGKTPATRANDYLWVHSYEHEGTISLRLGRVLGVELSEETFKPEELTADWRNKEPAWNVPREW
jgi:predicted DNA-binding transcriptional regulator YafY